MLLSLLPIMIILKVMMATVVAFIIIMPVTSSTVKHSAGFATVAGEATTGGNTGEGGWEGKGGGGSFA